jgi:hypothetical protein
MGGEQCNGRILIFERGYCIRHESSGCCGLRVELVCYYNNVRREIRES